VACALHFLQSSRRRSRVPMHAVAQADTLPTISVQIYRQAIEGGAELVYEDKDEAYNVHVFKTHDKALIVINSGATMQNEMHYIRADEPRSDFKARATPARGPVAPATSGVAGWQNCTRDDDQMCSTS
jgi:hypothetical protein